MKILFDKPLIKQIFPKRKSTNQVSGTNLKNIYQFQANNIENLKLIWIYSLHPTHGMFMKWMYATKIRDGLAGSSHCYFTILNPKIWACSNFDFQHCLEFIGPPQKKEFLKYFEGIVNPVVKGQANMAWPSQSCLKNC